MSRARITSIVALALVGLSAAMCSPFGQNPDPSASPPDGGDEGSIPNNEGGVVDPSCTPPAPATPSGNLFYIGPSGDDGVASGTRDKPFRTFTTALSKLRAGDALVLLDGEYKRETSGLLDIACNEVSVFNGQDDKPIFVRAENERKAWIHSDGLDPAIHLKGCSHWIIEGLFASSEDVLPDPVEKTVDVMALYYDTSCIARRNLIARTNRCGESSVGMITYGSTSMLLEENEVYDFHSSGIVMFGGTTIRANYAAARDWEKRADAPSCLVDSVLANAFADRGDKGLIESSVGEQSFGGVIVGEGTRIVGSIFWGNNSGVLGAPYWVDLSVGATVRETLIGRNDLGVWGRNWGFQLENVTLFGNTARAILTDDNGGAEPTFMGARKLDAARTLAFDNGPIAFQAIDSWSFDSSNVHSSANATPPAFPTVEPIDDDLGSVRRSRSEAPTGMGLGPNQCLAYVPKASSMHAATSDGADIGANLVHRYRDGVVTCERVWDPQTGRLRLCGATVVGVNDDLDGADTQTRSCVSIHKRVHVGTEGCSIP